MLARSYKFAVVVLLPAAALLAGCPQAPELGVVPMALSFSDNESRPVTLSNLGAGAITWQVESKPDWITVSPDHDVMAAAVQVVQVAVDITGLSAGNHTGMITFSSNGGTRSISVSASVAAPPTLQVAPDSLDFGGIDTTRTFAINNIGSGSLVWNIAAPPTGFSVSDASDTTAAGGSATITVTCNRALLQPGVNTGTLTITSNGGNATVALSAAVQALALSPASLDFASQLPQLPFTIRNNGDEQLHWTITGSTVPDWATFEPADLSGTLEAGQEHSIIVHVNRAGLPPEASIANVAVNSDGGSATLRLTILGPDPNLIITPLTLDFGSTDSEQDVTLENTGTGPLTWAIEEGVIENSSWSPANVSWLTANIVNGETAPGGHETITVAVDRTTVTPDAEHPYEAYLRVAATNGQEALIHVIQRALPPTLRVLPQALDFGTTYVTKKVAIWNGGLGAITWRIDTTGNPSWLQILPVNGAGISSGTVTGEESDMIEVRVDRSGLQPADQDYACAFEIAAQDGVGNTLASAMVDVVMNVARTPIIVIDTGVNGQGDPNVDGDKIPFIPLGTTLTSSSFSISNVGSGTLSWSIPISELPEWLKSINPAQGTLEPQQSVAVTVTVNREGLPSGDEKHTLTIESNDPLKQSAPVRVEMQIPLMLSIGGRPTKLDFGLYGISDVAEVANLGDPGSILNFAVESNKPWLYFYPETGSSEGTSSPIKDWQSINISIDRSRLDNSGSTGTLRVTAFEINDDGQRVPLPDVEPLEITVNVQAAPLSFEAAVVRGRIPSLIRNVCLMRDISYNSIDIPDDMLDLYRDSFSIFEKDLPLEIVESGQFLTSGDNLKTNVVILMDYSNSMYDAAASVSDPAIAGAPDPLQALYLQSVGTLIDSLPDFYAVALMEYHERHQGPRVVQAGGGDDGGLTTDRALLHQRLESISIPDHGATEFLPAVMDAAYKLWKYDLAPPRIGFDDTDVKALICISDGRMTTPPGQIKDVIEYLVDAHVRFMPIGWGDGVMHEPLARLAAGTGGHYYPTSNEVIGTAQDGSVETRPVAANLLDWCQQEDPLLMPCDQSIARDLQSQIVLSYVTLLEESPVKLRVDAVFDNPVDGTECLVDQGVINGSMTQKDLDYSSLVGDVKLGQISLKSTGVNIFGGTDRVIVRAEYIPRNVDHFQFRFTVPCDIDDVYVAPKENGGIVSDWDVVEDEAQPGVYTLTRPEGVAPLAYGAYGDLLYVDMSGITEPFDFGFEVLDPVYAEGAQFQKYFTCPDHPTVTAFPTFAPAFPTPAVTSEFITEDMGDPIDESDDMDNVLPFGTDAVTRTFEIRNYGGSHEPTGVILNWEITDCPPFVKVEKTKGTLVSNSDVNVVTVTLDRSIDAADYSEPLVLLFNSGSLDQEYTFTINLTATVEDPVCVVTSPSFEAGTQTADLGATGESVELTISNNGQSTLEWVVDLDSLPPWLNLTLSTGDVVNGKPQTTTATVTRAGLAPGPYTHTFNVNSTVEPVPVTITMTVP